MKLLIKSFCISLVLVVLSSLFLNLEFRFGFTERLFTVIMTGLLFSLFFINDMEYPVGRDYDDTNNIE